MDQDFRNSYLIMELSKLRFSPKVDDAFSWLSYQFQAKDYLEFKDKYPRGSPERRAFATVCNFFELAGNLLLQGLLAEDIFFEMGFGLNTAWQKVKHIMPGYRAETDPRLYENFEWLYKKSLQWNELHPPKV